MRIAMSDAIPPMTDPVPVFPLPNVVLLPGAVLPLQVFEPRYRAMVRDVLDDSGLIAMALLRPGYEPQYHTNLAEIHAVVCVGRIREHVQIPDGRYFINLVGLCRARVRQEIRPGPYRLAHLDPMVRRGSGVDLDGEYGARESFRCLLHARPFDALEGIDESRAAVTDPITLDEVVDLVAAHLLPPDAVEIKQLLLEDMNVLRRSEILLSELGAIHRALEARDRSNDEWPRFGSMN